MNDKETEQYFRDMRELLRSAGWNHLMADIKLSADSVNSVELTKDVNDLYFRKGQLAVMANLLNLELQIDSAEAEFENESTE